MQVEGVAQVKEEPVNAPKRRTFSATVEEGAHSGKESDNESDYSEDNDIVVGHRASKVRKEGSDSYLYIDLPEVKMERGTTLDNWVLSNHLFERACCEDTNSLNALHKSGLSCNEAIAFYALYLHRSDIKKIPAESTAALVHWLRYNLEQLSTLSSSVETLEGRQLAGYFHGILGVCYLKGIGGLVVNFATAVQHLLLAQSNEEGHGELVAPFAAHYLAACYAEEDTDGIEKNEEEAFRLFTWAAAPPRNFVLSQARLARAYEFGHGINKNLPLAAHWHQAAAVQGYIPSQYELGRLLNSGGGKKSNATNDVDSSTSHLPVNQTEALYWFRRAATEDVTTGEVLTTASGLCEPKAQVMLGYYYEHGLGGVEINEERALYWYLQAASHGEPTGQQNVGVCYEKGIGLENRQPNHQLAAVYFGKAARKGLLSAIYRRGYGYHYGRGVEQNYRKAAFWYRKGYERGHAEATYSLALLYRYGQGVEKQDLLEAARLTRLSAQRGSLSGMCYMGVICGRGQGIAKDEMAELQWYREAADRGYALAQYYLGNIYFNGNPSIGIHVDYVEAVRWFQESAERGENQAQKKLALCFEQGHGVEVDAEVAAYWRRNAETSGSSCSTASSNLINHRRILVLKQGGATRVGSSSSSNNNNNNNNNNTAVLERQRREDQERRRVEASIDDLVTAMPALLSLE